jgi:hypothetical protein
MIIPWQKQASFGHRWRNRVRVCSSGSLVYLATLKCASTFFYTNLVDNFKWEEIKFSDIDWANQRVFSHLLDPVERRHKAIAEYLFMTNTQDLWYSSPNFRQMISGVASLDEHSMSYFETYGNYAWMIDWIPLNTEHSNVIQFTNKLLNSYGQVLLDKWDLELAHVSTPEKINLAKEIRAQWQSQEHHADNINVYFERDSTLYRQVIKNFNQFGDRWGDISWLRDRLPVY